MGDGKRRPYANKLGDEALVGATLAVAHPESSTASFPSYEVASRDDPNEAVGKPGMGDGKRRPYANKLGDEALDRVWATASVAPTPTSSATRPS